MQEGALGGLLKKSQIASSVKSYPKSLSRCPLVVPTSGTQGWGPCLAQGCDQKCVTHLGRTPFTAQANSFSLSVFVSGMTPSNSALARERRASTLVPKGQGPGLERCASSRSLTG